MIRVKNIKPIWHDVQRRKRKNKGVPKLPRLDRMYHSRNLSKLVDLVTKWPNSAIHQQDNRVYFSRWEIRESRALISDRQWYGLLSIYFQVDYPEIVDGIEPRHRFMSAYEQHIEPPDRKWQYLLFAAEPYETISFKLPSREIDKVRSSARTSARVRNCFRLIL